MEHVCDFCGINLEDVDGKERMTRFCSGDCRTDYHNTRRKADRAEQRARDAMHQLAEAAAGDAPINRAIALQLYTLKVKFEQLAFIMNWRCTECGQQTMFQPMDDCDFCGHDKFRPVMPVDNDYSR